MRTTPLKKLRQPFKVFSKLYQRALLTWVNKAISNSTTIIIVVVMVVKVVVVVFVVVVVAVVVAVVDIDIIINKGI